MEVPRCDMLCVLPRVDPCAGQAGTAAVALDVGCFGLLHLGVKDCCFGGPSCLAQPWTCYAWRSQCGDCEYAGRELDLPRP
jgi:hypothetical protein